MKKSYWIIFGFVLFVLILIIVLGIFLLSNKSDALSGDQPVTPGYLSGGISELI